jgi:hypothetical protein
MIDKELFMKFDVFQINLSDEENSVPMIREAYLDTIMKPNAAAILKAKVMMFSKLATLVLKKKFKESTVCIPSPLVM